MTEKDAVGTTHAGAGAAEPETGWEVEVLKSAMKNYSVILNTLFNDLEDE